MVSFTFSGTYRGQEEAARVLADAGAAGTFYVSSGYLGFPDYLDVDAVREIARQRSEVGGAALDSRSLVLMDTAQTRRQVCDDRATLAALGLAPTSFAYPRGGWSYRAQSVARSCGYNSARGIAGLRGARSCEACPGTETVPPRNPYALRTATSSTRLPDLRRAVQAAQRSGGGWVPLVFGRVCACPKGEAGTVTVRELRRMVRWATARPGVEVQTVDQVVGGEVAPVEGTPLPRLVPPPRTVRQEAIPAAPLVRVLGVPVEQGQIIFTGLLLTVAVVITYRRATRAVRHGQ